MVSASATPALFSRMSLRTMSDLDGNGPAVSLGATAHASLLDEVPPVAPVPAAVVTVDATADGLVAVSLPHAAATAAAPAAPKIRITSRLSSLFSFALSLFIPFVLRAFPSHKSQIASRLWHRLLIE
jgi:hypothetical protein